MERFEREFASFVGSRYAVACSSGTAALHVALLLAGAQPDSLVAAPTLTFVASVNAISYTGAETWLIDSEPYTWNVDSARLAEEIDKRAAAGRPLPGVVEVVHLYGNPVDMEPLFSIRDRFGIILVEDAAEALGASYTDGPASGRRVGTVGLIGCFSFNGNKTVTAGGGGMIVTDEEELAAQARHLTTQAKLPGLGYKHDRIGFNYRLTNVAAAVGLAQLERAEELLSRKKAIATAYRQALTDMPYTPQGVPTWADASYWLYSIEHDVGIDAYRSTSFLVDMGIEARPIWEPVHLQDPYERTERLGGEVAERIASSAFSLPSSTRLSPEDQDRVVLALEELSRETRPNR